MASSDAQAYRRAYQSDRERRRLVSFVDIAPTVLALAGVQLAADERSALHGRDFLLGKKRQYVFASRDRIDGVLDRQRAVRDKRYKYIRSWHPDLGGGHALAYRDNLEMVRALRAAALAGELSATQAQWFEAPGVERLFDLKHDPHELNNLLATGVPATPPSRRARRVAARLRGELEQWLTRVGDWSEDSEASMRKRLLDVDGQIPQTPEPVVAIADGLITVVAADKASIGYRLGPRGRWRLYRQPFRLAAVTQKVQFKAQRYGMRESPVIGLPGAN